MKSVTLIRIGHRAYSGSNAIKIVKSRSAAIQELRNRGMLRSDARMVINKVLSKDYGYEIAYFQKEQEKNGIKIYSNDLVEIFNCAADRNYNY